MGAARYEGAFSLTESSGPAYERRGAVAKRAGSRLPGHTPNNLYETRDGEHIHIAAANQSLFRRLAVLMERSDLLDDPRFSTPVARRSEEHTSELQSLMRISYAVFCLKKKKKKHKLHTNTYN